MESSFLQQLTKKMVLEYITDHISEILSHTETREKTSGFSIWFGDRNNSFCLNIYYKESTYSIKKQNNLPKYSLYYEIVCYNIVFDTICDEYNKNDKLTKIISTIYRYVTETIVSSGRLLAPNTVITILEHIITSLEDVVYMDYESSYEALSRISKRPKDALNSMLAAIANRLFSIDVIKTELQTFDITIRNFANLCDAIRVIRNVIPDKECLRLILICFGVARIHPEKMYYNNQEEKTNLLERCITGLVDMDLALDKNIDGMYNKNSMAYKIANLTRYTDYINKNPARYCPFRSLLACDSSIGITTIIAKMESYVVVLYDIQKIETIPVRECAEVPESICKDVLWYIPQIMVCRLGTRYVMINDVTNIKSVMEKISECCTSSSTWEFIFHKFIQNKPKNIYPITCDDVADILCQLSRRVTVSTLRPILSDEVKYLYLPTNITE